MAHLNSRNALRVVRTALLLGFMFLSCRANAQVSDSLRTLMHNEVDFIADFIRKNSVDPYRGISEREWNEALRNIHLSVDSCSTKREYWYLLRQFGAMINDYHAEFPDNGLYNRTGIFRKDDLLLPVWVKVWDDGRVFVKSDLTGSIPDNAEIISINGRTAKDLALDMRRLNPSEEGYAKYRGYSVEMVDPYIWNSFIGYLHCEGIASPYVIEYETGGCRQMVTVAGKPRQEYKEWYDNGVGKEIMEMDRPAYYFTKLGKNAINYRVVQDSIAVVKVSSWIGSNILRMLLTKRDPGFRKKLVEVMDDVMKNDYPVLIIDIRGNIGGNADNVSDFIHYFVDEPIPYSKVYRVTPDNRKLVKKLLKMSYSYLGKAETKASYRALENTPDYALFRNDTLMPVHYYSPLRHRKYEGEVYVLVDEGSYSASILFAKLMKKMNAGKIAGVSPGGYSLLTSGNNTTKPLPFTKYFIISVPYAADNPDSEDGYHYLEVDIPLPPSLESWKDGTYDSLELLLEYINNR